MHIVIKNAADGGWILAPSNIFIVYTPKESYLKSSARPFGEPPLNISACSPLPRRDMEQVAKWQEVGHKHLESTLGVKVCGYGTLVDLNLPPRMALPLLCIGRHSCRIYAPLCAVAFDGVLSELA